jgi:hypothetical protein
VGLLFHEAALAVVRHVLARARRSGRPPQEAFQQFPSLAAYADEIRRRMPADADWQDAPAWLRSAIAEWENDAGVLLPLKTLDHIGIGPDARVLLVVLGLVEEDATFASLFAALQAPLSHRRPTLGLLREMVQEFPHDGALPDAWALCRPLVDGGFAEVLNPDAPRSEWLLRVPPSVWTAIRGDSSPEPIPGLSHRVQGDALPLAQLIVPDGQIRRLQQVAHLLAERRVRTLVVRGMPGSERMEIAAALAAAIGRGVLEVAQDQRAQARDERLARLGPLATLLRALPLFAPELGPAEVFTVPQLAGYTGPVAVILGREGGVAGTTESVSVEVPADAVQLRKRHWARALDSQAADLDDIAEMCTLSGRYIRQCAPVAVAACSLDGRAAVSVDDVRQASRAINRQVLEALATPLMPVGSWDQLVVGTGTESELRDLERRCRYREQLTACVGDGFPGGLNRGVKALFEGPSGCGKTLAARVIASQVGRGLDLYRVDLAAVINKYIGETEKNLSRILSRAEDLDVILLLDEGDALLSRRTDVRSSNDRYANLETNYLLQRLETYDGICIITTNLGAQIDPAFRRRMDVVARFHLPDAEQRWRLWHLHLPPEHAVDPEALEEASVRYALSGGQVRNAALYAVMSALNRGGRVEKRDLIAGIELEHRKAGASFPRESAATRADGEALDRFVSTIF